MGYRTDFEGEIAISPPLNPHEIAYLREFAETRHMSRTRGPYVLGDDEADVLNHGTPPPEQPGLWCGWEPTEDGTALKWDGVEKFYDSVEWMAYLIAAFLETSATVETELGNPIIGRTYPKAFQHFTFDHVLNGVIDAQGKAPSDRWRLVVTNNEVSRCEVEQSPSVVRAHDCPFCQCDGDAA